MNAVIYARYSSDRQTEQSIEGQIRFCTQYAQQHGYNVIKHYVDRAISGTTDHRPQFQQMIADSAKRQFQFVIVWKLDRFARNRYDSAIYKSKLKKNGVKVLSATEGIGEGDESIILEAVLEAMAETYSRQLSQNVRRGMRESALKGNSTGGAIPLGYKLEGKKLSVDEETAPIVRYIFERYAAGASKTEIAAYLNDRGHRTKSGTKFTVNSFRTILSNPKYIGVYHYDEVSVEDGCPALIEKELFDDVQKKTAATKRAPAHKKAKVEYLLNGKLFCGYCASPMVGDCGTSKTGERYYYYSCAARKKKPKSCKKKREKKDFIEWYVVEQTVDYVLTPSRIDYIAERVVEEYNKGCSDDEIKRLEKEITKHDAEIGQCAEALIGAKTSGIIDKINEKAMQIEARKQEAEESLINLRLAGKYQLKKEEVAAWLTSFCKGDLFDMEFRKRIIDVFINAIYLYDDKVVIYFNVRGGKQVSYMEMIDDTTDFFDNITESSNFAHSGPPMSTLHLCARAGSQPLHRDNQRFLLNFPTWGWNHQIAWMTMCFYLNHNFLKQILERFFVLSPLFLFFRQLILDRTQKHLFLKNKIQKYLDYLLTIPKLWDIIYSG